MGIRRQYTVEIGGISNEVSKLLKLLYFLGFRA